MSHSTCPSHIASLIKQLEINDDAEEVLLKNVNLITIDTELYNLYDELSFDPSLASFTLIPDMDTVMQRLREIYQIEEYYD